MRLGDVANADAARHGKPLEGVRILAVEQMQALPFATQLLARLGAEVVKVEHPIHGESGRGSLPAIPDQQGRPCGATYVRNNFNKRSVGIDLKHPRGRELFLALAPASTSWPRTSSRGPWTGWRWATKTWRGHTRR
jgi:crotonobetainyl-CoA:carnitine CoA-transferase CaiB-like acyl-CoA transferase